MSAVDAVKALDAKSFTYSVRSGGQKRDVSIPLTVVPHRTKNFRKGVITCAELRDTSDEEIADGLSNFGVTEARRITFRRGGSIIPTDSVVLTFDATDLPSSVTVGYMIGYECALIFPIQCAATGASALGTQRRTVETDQPAGSAPPSNT